MVLALSFCFPAVYKPIDVPGMDVPNSSELVLLPPHDPYYNRLPWAKLGLVKWGVVMLLAPLFGAALVGAVYSFIAAKAAARRARSKQPVTVGLSSVPTQAKAVDLGP